MSSKLNFVPHIASYETIRKMMQDDLSYRLGSRFERTSLGRPLYLRINVQLIMTQECPYSCPFCIERKNPMAGSFNADKQIASLKEVLREHPNARLTVTGGEPGLYPDHVRRIAECYQNSGNNMFMSINTAGYCPELSKYGHVNLSVNEYVHPDITLFPGCTIQTVVPDEKMEIALIKSFMDQHEDGYSFSFRFLSDMNDRMYNVNIFNEIQNDPDVRVKTFRVGDFFVYLTFDYNRKHARITLGDMYQQSHNEYLDGYSNIIIHPDGSVNVNWT